MEQIRCSRPGTAVRFVREGGAWRREAARVDVVEEVAVSLEVVGVGRFTIMALPRDLRALALGFLASEGLIASVADVAELTIGEDHPCSLVVRLADPDSARAADGSAKITVLTAAGRAGQPAVGRDASLRPVGWTFVTTPGAIVTAHDTMCARQVIRQRTRGTHSAAIFDARGRVLVSAEDVGRHNAVDKVVGAMMSREEPTAGRGMLLSGRVSLEMVAKCARAGIELIAAVSAPTSLAVTAATDCHITLCYAVGGESLVGLTHASRLACPDPE
jgi:FdhD protein